MPDQIALIETPVYETTGEPGPRVLHELCKFELLGTLCRVHVSAADDMLDLCIGKRRFAVSVMDLAATAALSVEAHLRGEIRARIIASRETPQPLQVAPPPACDAVEADGFVTLYPRPQVH